MRDEGLKSSGEIDVAKLGGGGPSDQSKPDNRPNKPRGSPIILPDNGQLFLSWGPVWMWTVHLIRSLIVFVLLYFGAAYFHSTTLGVLSLPLSVNGMGMVGGCCVMVY
jgi:hypothetical protein